MPDGSTSLTRPKSRMTVSMSPSRASTECATRSAVPKKMEPCSSPNHAANGAGAESRQLRHVSSQPLEEVAVANQGYLNSLGDPRNPVTRWQGSDKLDIVDHREWR